MSHPYTGPFVCYAAVRLANCRRHRGISPQSPRSPLTCAIGGVLVVTVWHITARNPVSETTIVTAVILPEKIVRPTCQIGMSDLIRGAVTV